MDTMDSVMIAILIVVIAVAGLYLLLLPAELAKKRNHPKTHEIKILCYASLLIWPLWPVALVWALMNGTSLAPTPAATPVMSSRIPQELCENCGTGIGKLETPQIWKNHVICSTCYSKLAKT